jgi:hypothetical protein
VPIAVAGREILAGVLRRRVLAQRLFDDAERFDVGLPVHRADETQTADAVGDRNLVGRGNPSGRFRQLAGGHALFEQFLLDPGLHEGHGGRLRLQPVVELLDERRGQRHVCMGELGQQVDQLPGLGFRRGKHAVGPGDRRVALLAALGDAHRDAAQIFQQRQLQHDREGPQLAQLQGLDGLVSGDELGGVVAVDAAIHVRDQFQCQVVDAGKAGRRPIGQPRQLSAVGARQVPARQADLLLDQVEVVEQPGLGWHDPLPRRRGGGHDVVRRQQNPGVVRQPWQQLVRPAPRFDSMLARQRDRVTFQLLDAEQLRTQQLGIAVSTQRIARA